MIQSLRASVGSVAIPLVALALAGCGSIDPALQAEVDSVWAHASSDRVHENGPAMPWQVGHWAQMRIDDGGALGFRTISLSKQEGSSYWLEVREVWPERETRALALVEGYDPGRPRDLSVSQIKVRTDAGDVVDLADEEADVPDAAEIRAGVMEMMDAIRHRGRTNNVCDLVGPAGTFKDTQTRPIFARRGGDIWGGYVWYTNAVPVLGFARLEATRPFLEFLSSTKSIEIVAFGDGGVESMFID